MKIHKSEIVVPLMILASFVLGIYVYPLLPEMVASHWGADGEVNGYMPKFWGVFLLPMISVAVFALLAGIPRVDPKKKNIEKFRKYYDIFLIVFFTFLFYLYALTLSWNFGMRFNMTQLLAPAFAALFFAIGVMVRHADPNWSIGIRTPWTLSNETVWKKTHEVGGRLFIYSSAIAAGGYFVPAYAIWFMIVPVIFTALFTVVYSYVIYTKIVKK
jgi:uncharacterized membrane protein